MPKPRKIPTPQNLSNVALHYLERYAASEASLRRVLTNRIRRAAMQHPDFAADEGRQQELRSAIETIIALHKRTGILNDTAFAEMRVHSLRRQGRSRRVIEQKLMTKGVARDTIKAALAGHDDDADPREIERQAALTLARRRKWGPFRKKPVDVEARRKDFAALARAGFSADIVRAVLDYDFEDE
ncbi:MAG: regulatory protein RecX [Alphaproteobacteria bacterium]|nr:regulatory protein RecX [Alphaproteobacteria bacterium]